MRIFFSALLGQRVVSLGLRRPRIWPTIFAVLLVALSSGCGKKEAARDTGEFESYLNQFEKEFHEYSGFQLAEPSIRIHRGTLTKSQLAVCRLNAEGADITVNDMYWDSLSSTHRELVMYHEFGHCLESRKHEDSEGDGRKYKSIMNSMPQLLVDYKDHREDYVRELLGVEKRR